MSLVRSYISELVIENARNTNLSIYEVVEYRDYRRQLNEALEVKEILRDLLRAALDAGAIALTGGMGGDTVVDIIFAVEASAEILSAIDDAINSASEIAKAIGAAMSTNISAGAEAIYTAVDDVVTSIAESGDFGDDLIDSMAEGIQDLLNKLISAVGDWVATVLPDDAGLGGILVREALEAVLEKLGENVYEALKTAFGALPDETQEFVGSPMAMANFLNEIADTIIAYIDGEDVEEEGEEGEGEEGEGGEEEEEGILSKIGGAVKTGGDIASTVANPTGALLSKVVMTKARDFLDTDFREMIPKATQILNKLITAFFGAVALAQILARWDAGEEGGGEAGEGGEGEEGKEGEKKEEAIRAYVRELLLLEKKYQPPVEQDVVHGLDFAEMRQHISHHFGKAKITLTGSPLDLERNYPPSTRLKPAGIWYGCGGGWLEFVEENAWESTSGNQIWSLKIDMSNVKSLTDTKEIDKFSREYRDMKRYLKDHRNKRVDWALVQGNFSGIECCPYPVGDWEFKLKHDWYYAIDMSSGCIWNPSAISSSILVAELKEDGWEMYV